MVTKPANEQSQDFSIHNEDFPALPGSSYKDPTSSNDDSKSVSSWGHGCEGYSFLPLDLPYTNSYWLDAATELFEHCNNLTSEECRKLYKLEDSHFFPISYRFANFCWTCQLI